MKALHVVIALAVSLGKVHACRHSIFRNGFKLTALEIQLLVIFAILLVFLIVNTAAFLNIRAKLKAISNERRLRLLAMYKLQKRGRIQALLPVAYLRNYYEQQITPFNAEKQDRRDDRQVRYVLHKRKLK